jgi:archaellum component FlaC
MNNAADEIERLKKELNKLVSLYNYRVLSVHNALNDLRNQELNLPAGVTIRWGFLNELYEMQVVERQVVND